MILALRRWFPLVFIAGIPAALAAAVIFGSLASVAIALLLLPIGVGTGLQFGSPLPQRLELPAIAAGVAGIVVMVNVLAVSGLAGAASTIAFMAALLGGMHTMAIADLLRRRARGRPR